jgi:hypothetical protein
MGNQIAGAVWTGLTPNAKRASRFSSTAAASVTSISAYVDGGAATSGSQPLRGVIYSDDAGDPGRPLATSSEVTILAGRAAGWVTLSLASPVSLAAGTYWLALHAGGSAKVGRYASTTVSAALRYDGAGDLYSDGASNPFGSTNDDDKRISIYTVGTDSADAVPADLLEEASLDVP